MKNDVNDTLAQLNNCEVLCNKALNDWQINNPDELKPTDKDKISKLLKRMFDAEKEYLQTNPSDYFEIYNDENN